MTDAEARERIDALDEPAWIKNMLAGRYIHAREAEGASVLDAFCEMLDLYKAIILCQEETQEDNE